VTQLRRLFDRAIAGPSYPPNDRDLRDISVLGIELPLRATVVVLAATALVVVDQTRLPSLAGLVGGGVLGIGAVPLVRLALFLVAPLTIVVFAFRDDPRRYGLRLGEWRWGVALLVAGLTVMTPIILALASVDSFRAYYSVSNASLPAAVAGSLVELVPAEFLFRGFLMFALWRRIGPLALVVQLIPFVLTHVGKPEIELWSTFIGGSLFAWLDWRTRSIIWSALGHVYVLTLMTVAVGGATGG
jgi:membrane protease YdiL (CAAX protease family)